MFLVTLPKQIQRVFIDNLRVKFLRYTGILCFQSFESTLEIMRWWLFDCLFSLPQCEIIGQFNQGFIITRLLDNDLFIVDQHATDEKFRYEEFLNNTKIVSQPLVCPQSLDLDPGKKEILKENLTALEELGFGIEVADNSKVKLTKVPHCDRIVLGKY